MVIFPHNDLIGYAFWKGLADVLGWRFRIGIFNAFIMFAHPFETATSYHYF
jgi:hypothetical protein